MKIHLVRDCLDKQAIDNKERKIGRIDGIAIETSGPGRPRVVAVEIGATTIANRTARPIAKWLNELIRKLSGAQENKLAVPWNKIEIERNEVHIKLDADRSSVRALEHWLRDRVIMRIPGA
jgi:hypothetical protein